jgi:hypothetical protein
MAPCGRELRLVFAVLIRSCSTLILKALVLHGKGLALSTRGVTKVPTYLPGVTKAPGGFRPPVSIHRKVYSHVPQSEYRVAKRRQGTKADFTRPRFARFDEWHGGCGHNNSSLELRVVCPSEGVRARGGVDALEPYQLPTHLDTIFSLTFKLFTSLSRHIFATYPDSIEESAKC